MGISIEDPSKLVTITRQDIARGQLETAITLWFLEKDVVSIHALAAASHEVLHGLGGKSNPTIIYGELKKAPGSKKQKGKKISEIRMSQNFFKHANSDRNEVIDFNPVVSEFLMFDAVRCYAGVFDSLTPLMRLFAARFLITWRPILGRLPEMHESVINIFPEPLFSGLSRKDFLDRGLDVLKKRPFVEVAS